MSVSDRELRVNECDRPAASCARIGGGFVRAQENGTRSPRPRAIWGPREIRRPPCSRPKVVKWMDQDAARKYRLVRMTRMAAA